MSQKKTKEVSTSDKVDKALFLNSQAVRYIQNIKINRIMLAESLSIIKSEELWMHMSMGEDSNFPSWAFYVATLDIAPATADKYIETFDYYSKELKVKTESLQDISIQKLDLIKGSKDPEKWLGVANDYGYSDLKKEVIADKTGVDLDKNITSNYNGKLTPEENEIKELKKEVGRLQGIICPMAELKKKRIRCKRLNEFIDDVVEKDKLI